MSFYDHTSVPAGYAGDISRNAGLLSETGILNQAKAPTSLGSPLKITAGRFEKIEAGDTADSFVGILARVVPYVQPVTGEEYDIKEPITVVREGYVKVKCTIGTPVRGGVVYMRVVADVGKEIGDLEATADGVNNVALPNAEWAIDGKDSSSISEIKIK